MRPSTLYRPGPEKISQTRINTYSTSGRYRKSSTQARKPLAWIVWIEVVAIATIMSPMSIAAHSGVSSPSARPRPAPEFDHGDEDRSCVRERDAYFDHGLLKHTELGFYEQLGPAGNTEKDADQDAGRSHWHPLPSVKHRQCALNHVRHVSGLFSRLSSSLPSSEQFDQCLGRGSRRSRILAGQDSTINYREGCPVGRLLVEAPDSLQLVFNQERHDMGQIDRSFFAVGEAGYALAFDERLALIHDAMEDTRRMTDSGHRLARVVERLDQRDGIGVIDNIPHWTVASHVKYGVELLRFHVGKLHRPRKSLLCFLILLKPRHRRGLLLQQVALWIDRGLASFWRSQRQFDTRVPEDKIRCREFLQPNTGFAASIAQLIVGR